MKIALLTDGIWPYVVGGMQKHSFLLCKYLARQGLHIVALHPETPDVSVEKLRSLFKQEETAFIEWAIIPHSRSFSFPGHYLAESYGYSRNCYQYLINRTDIGFIYAKGLTSWYLLKHKDRFDCGIGINIHGYEFMQLQANIREKFNALMLAFPFRFLHRRADYVFSYGSIITTYIRRLGVSDKRILEISGAVEADWLHTSGMVRRNNIKRRLFFIGRYERRKGIEEINQILLKRRLLDDFEFHFIGLIPEEKRLIIPGVYYHGELRTKEAIVDLMDTMDVLVCPSYSEGMPNVIMEAMSRGCAVIATNVGAVSTLVDEQNGWLIEPASLPELEYAISSAVGCSVDNIESMGRVSVNRIAKNFTWDIVGCKTADVIRPFLE